MAVVVRFLQGDPKKLDLRLPLFYVKSGIINSNMEIFSGVKYLFYIVKPNIEV